MTQLSLNKIFPAAILWAGAKAGIQLDCIAISHMRKKTMLVYTGVVRNDQTQNIFLKQNQYARAKRERKRKHQEF